ncbi:putative ribonuclease H-like domain-containing protein, partial [Tanacetum coccineum]
MYENFNASSTESLDSIFNRLQKIASQLAILGEIISQEDLDLKFLRSLPAEWNTHVVVWRNKLDLDTISLDDLYNNFKIVKQEVKRTVASSSNSSSTASTPTSTASTSDNTANLSDATVYAFLANQPNGSHLRTGKKITINGSDTAGYEKSKNQESSKRTVNVEDTTPKAMVAIDGAGFDWSFMEDEDVPTNMALMDFLDSELEKVKKEKESNQIKIDNFENASKSLDKLIGSQITDKSRKGVGFESYNAVAPPPTGLFIPPPNDLSYSGLEEFQQPKFEGYGVKVNKSVSENSSSEIKKTSNALIIEEWVSDSDKDEFEVKESDNVQHKPKQANQPRKMAQKPALNNVQKGTGQREVRPVWNNTMRVNHQNFSNSRRNFAPTTVLTKSGIVPISTARQSSSRASVPVSTARPINTDALKSLVNFVNTAKGNRVTSAVGEQGINVVKSSACWVWRPKIKELDHGDPQVALKDTEIFDSGCSRHMIGNKSYLTDYQDYDGGFVAFAGSSKRGKITRKGNIRTGKSDFEDLQDENQIMLKIPRKDNMYSFDLKNIVPSKGLTCLFAKATNDESKLWRRRLGQINFKTMNKLVKGNLVRGLPSKKFENDHTCVACQKGKQYKASCKSKLVNSVSQPLQILHMDLFGPTFVKSIMGKMYCLVVTNDYSKFSWVFFLAKKDETSAILKNFITGIENQLNHKVKIIRCDNRTEFKNYEMNRFCGIKGIKREFSNARTPQQNKVAERKNRTLIEVARTILADLLLPIPFWTEAVNTACYVQNRTFWLSSYYLDHLGKFDGKADEGFLVGYSINSKAFRVFNSRIRKVEENLNVKFLENKPNVARNGPEWLFDIDTLTNTINYQPVSAGNKTNGNAGLETTSDARQGGKDKEPDQEYILLPLLQTSSYVPSSYEEGESSPKDDARKKDGVKDPAKEDGMNGPGEATNTNSTNRLNTVSSSFTLVDPREQRNEFESLFEQDKDDNNTYRVFTPVNIATPFDTDYPIDPLMPDLEDIVNLHDIGIFRSAYDDEDVDAEDINNLETTMSVSPIPTTRIYKDHPKDQIIREVHSAVQTGRMHKQNEAGLITFIHKQRRTNHKDFQNCLFACFLSQMEPKKVTQALDDERWVEAVQEELLQFKLLNVWTLVDLPHGKRAIGTKWVFRNKKDQRGIVVRNKARLVAQGHRQEEGIEYDEVFALVARIKAIRLFFAHASFMDFTVYQMDVKSAFLYGTIEEEVYVSQPPGFVDPEFPNRVYKVEKALYGLHQAPRAWYETLSTYLLENGFRRGTIDKTLFIKKIK